jgi:hypothetical protein
MRVAVQHDLGKEEARRRLQSRGHEIADMVPGNMAEVTTGWPSEDRMTITVAAMGQEMGGAVDIEDAQVVFEIQLPAMLSFMEPAMKGAVEKNAGKLLAPPKD